MGFNSGFKRLIRGQFICKRLSAFYKVKVKVKQSHYRPGQALRVPEG